MDERSRGIILRTRPLTETSLIVLWITADAGRIATVAKGARRPKSPFRGKLDLFYEADFSFVRSRRSELHSLREVKVREFRGELRREVSWLEQASYAANLIARATETETPLPAVFALLEEFLAILPFHPLPSHPLLAFETKLLCELGLLPDPMQLPATAGVRQVLIRFRDSHWPGLSSLRLHAAQTKELNGFLEDSWRRHLGEVPGGRAAAIGLPG